MTFIKQQSKVRGQASADLEQLIQSKEISDYCESPHFEAMDITALLAVQACIPNVWFMP